MERLVVQGVSLEIRRERPGCAGSGAPIVFLHEGLGSIAMWRDWPARLCQQTGREGVVYSRRGYGHSDPIADVRGGGRLGPDYMHREARQALPALLDALGIERPVLLGHSDGGSIALLHASERDVAACVVMAPHVIVEDISVKSIRQAKMAFERNGLRERLGRFHEDVDSAFWQWNDVWLSEAFRSFDIRADCRRIAAPVLAIQGVDDAYGTMRQIEEIAPTQGRFEMAKIAGCGHSPHKDQPEAVAARIASFLDGID